jgi:hypothetical protein
VYVFRYFNSSIIMDLNLFHRIEVKRRESCAIDGEKMGISNVMYLSIFLSLPSPPRPARLFFLRALSKSVSLIEARTVEISFAPAKWRFHLRIIAIFFVSYFIYANCLLTSQSACTHTRARDRAAWALRQKFLRAEH